MARAVLKRRTGRRSTIGGVILVLAVLSVLGACSAPSPDPGGEFKLEGDVRPESDVTVDGGSFDIDSLEVPAGVTLSADGNLVLTVAGDVEVLGTLEASGRLELRVSGDVTVAGTLGGGGASAATAAGLPVSAASGTPLGEIDAGVTVVASGDVTFDSDAEVVSAGPVVITDDLDQLLRTPDDVNAEAETASGTDPTLMPLPPDDEAFDEEDAEPSRAAVMPTQGQRQIGIRGVWDLSGWPGDRPVVLFWFSGAADLFLDDLTIRGPKGVTPEPDDASGDPGSDAEGEDGKDGMNLNIRNRGGPITVAGTTVFALTDGGDGGDATVVCATATGGKGGKPGNFRMTASGGIFIQGVLRIEPGDGGKGGDATATGTGGCDVAAVGGDGAEVSKRLLVRGNVQGIDGIEIGDQVGGHGGSANATAGDGVDGAACEPGQDGGNATAAGGAGGSSTIKAGPPVTVGDAIAGVGGEATAAGGEGGAGGPCPGGLGGAGGAGGAATATGGDAGEDTEPAAGGTASATGGDAGIGGDTCGPPDGLGGDGGVGGAATATGGEGSDGTRAATSGAGGAGADGGDGATPGAGGAGGPGQGNPDDLPDGVAGVDGPLCPGAPPPQEVALLIDFSEVPSGVIEPGSSYCLPVHTEDESVDASNVFALVTFSYSAGTAGVLASADGVSPASIRDGDLIRFLGWITIALAFNDCSLPLPYPLAVHQLALELAYVQSGGSVLLWALVGNEWLSLASLAAAGLLTASLPGGAYSWQIANEFFAAGSSDSGFYLASVIATVLRADLLSAMNRDSGSLE